MVNPCLCLLAFGKNSLHWESEMGRLELARSTVLTGDFANSGGVSAASDSPNSTNSPPLTGEKKRVRKGDANLFTFACSLTPIAF
jgi:hypothetical protein